jgi:HEAT repeat protein
VSEPTYGDKTVAEWIAAVRSGSVESPEAYGALSDGRVGPKAKSAVPVLIEALEDCTEGIPFNVRYVAAFALGRIGASAKSAIPALQKRVWEDDDRSTVLDSATALSRIGAKQCGVEFWSRLLSHEDATIGRIAAGALGKIGPEASGASDCLVGALSSHVAFGLPQLYCEAMKTLLKIVPDDPRLIGELRRGLGFGNYGYQKTAVEGLARIGTEEAFDVLRHLYDHLPSTYISPPLERLIDKLKAAFAELEIQPRASAQCPECGKTLRSALAKQCFECGADWH